VDIQSDQKLNSKLKMKELALQTDQDDNVVNPVALHQNFITSPQGDKILFKSVTM
jgi:hypothetical protein